MIGNAPDPDATIPAQGILKLASQLGSVFALDLPGGRLVVVSGQELVDKLCDEPGSNTKLYAPLQRVREYLSDGGQSGVAAWTAEYGRLATASAWWDREGRLPVDVVQGTFMIEGAKVFDGFRFLRCASVLVVDGQVAALEERLTPPADTPVVDGAGATVLPGLIDAHTHALPGALEAALRFGVTTELDMFADPHLIRSLKQQAAADSAGMAGLRSAGTGATAPGGHPTSLVDRGLLAPFPTITSPGQAETFVADRIAEGSDYLKVILEDGTTTGYPCSKLTSDIVHALIHAAHAQGRIVVVHALTQVDALLAVRAGADGLAHLFLDQPPLVEFIDAAAQSGVFVISTLTSLAARTGHRRGQELQADPHLGPRLNDQQRFFLAMEFPVGPAAQADLDNAMETVSRLHQAGVTLLAGTDAFIPGTAHGASLHDELALLVHAGLTPAAALATATSAPAAAFAVDRGRIASGLGADLVLIHGDPELDIISTRAIRKIWRNGQQTAR